MPFFPELRIRPVRPNNLMRAALVVLCSFGLASTAWAQDELQNAPQTITFDEALRLALDQNIDLRKSERNVDLQSTLINSARADFLPNLSLSASPTQQYGLTFDQTAGELVSETTEAFSLNASTNLNLFNGFADVASLRQARLDYETANYLNEQTQDDVLSNVAFNFLQVILDKEQIRIQEENLDAQGQLLSRVQEFTRVGSRPISELFQQEAQVAQSELELLNAQRDYQLSQVALIRVLQLDPLGAYDFVAPSVDDTDPLVQEYDLNALFRQAFEQRSDLKAQRTTIEANEQGIRIARSEYLPTLSVGAGLGTAYSSQRVMPDPATGQLEGIPFGDQLRDNRGGSVRLNFSIPIFNRLNTRANVERAQILYNNSRLDYDALQQQVALEVRQAYLDYLTASKQVEVSEKQLRSAEQALAAEQERYNVGASTLVELTQSRAAYEQAAGNRVTAVYTFLTRAKLLDYYTGTLDPSLSIFE